MAGVAGRNANKIREDDIIYATLPLYHTSTGILGASQTLICGSTMALREKFSATNFWKDCIKYEATVCSHNKRISKLQFYIMVAQHTASTRLLCVPYKNELSQGKRALSCIAR
jgi:acyl-CoA synthetase (AMP-forming)/AMP-acid ligase II